MGIKEIIPGYIKQALFQAVKNGWENGKRKNGLDEKAYQGRTIRQVVKETARETFKALLKSDAETQKCVRKIMGKDLPLLEAQVNPQIAEGEKLF